MKKIILTCLAILCFNTVTWAGTGIRPFDPDEPFLHMAWSPDGRHLALGRQDNRTILLYDAAAEQAHDLKTGLGSGFRFEWSPDGKRIAYKAIDGKQCVRTIDVASGRTETIADAALSGQPVWMDAQRLAYPIGNKTIVEATNGRLSFALGDYVNQIALSPDRGMIYYCLGRELHRVNLLTSMNDVLHRSESDIFNPSVSPDGRAVLVSTMDNELLVVDAKTGQAKPIGQGRFAQWVDGDEILFSRRHYDNMTLIASELVVSNVAKGDLQVLLSDMEFPGAAAVCGDRIAVISLEKGTVFVGRLSADKGAISGLREIDLGGLSRPDWKDPMTDESGPKSALTGWMPYIHQVYDTPNWFDGSAACGPTSCLMAIEYYHRFPVWLDTVNVGANPPGTHEIQFGRYDCEVYTYNGYAFDDTCSTPDPSPDIAYGAFGSCCTHGSGAWAYKCRDYIRRHNLSSDYNLSVSWEDVTYEIDNGWPMAMSTTITAAGHLMCVRGYVDGQHTVIVNDPAGNRNNGAYWNWPGENARYDWPGYNNGYVNINSASWLVTARGKHTRLSVLNPPDTMDAGHYVTVSVSDTSAQGQQNNTLFLDVVDNGSGGTIQYSTFTGLYDSLGGVRNFMNFSVPSSYSSVYFNSCLTPSGGNFNTRYISDQTDDDPTVIRLPSPQASMVNGSFETGLWPWANTENAVPSQNAIAHAGSYALRVTPNSPGYPVPAVAHQDVAVTPGQSYAFSGWARKNDGIGNTVRLAMMWYSPAHAQVGSSMNSASLTTDSPDYQNLSTGSQTAPPGAAYACLRLYVYAYGPTGDNFDDLAFSGPTSASLQEFGCASVSGNTVSLRWRTASEEDVLEWVVERTDANNGTFMDIGTLIATGNSQIGKEYHYYDIVSHPGRFQYRLAGVSTSGERCYYGPIEVWVDASQDDKLSGNHPNPFAQSTLINYQLSTPGFVTLRIYNTAGQAVRTLVNVEQQPGKYTALWDGNDNAGRKASTGIYVCRLQCGGRQIGLNKMIKVR